MATGTATALSSTPRRRSHGKLIFFAVFAAITILVTVGKNAQIMNPASEIAKHFAPVMMFLIPHAIFAGVALVLGIFQFSNRLRAKYLRVHRAMGYIYIVCVFIGGPLGVVVAYQLPPHVFMAAGVQALGWASCTAVALYCIRNGNVQQHRRWMMRGYPFAMVFTVARMIIPLPPVMKLGEAGIIETVWTVVALAALLPNFFLEWEAIRMKRVRATA